jgi:hypothetical protein
LADALGAEANEILFSGQSAIPELIREQTTGVLLLILAAKAAAYAVSLASGFRGGPIFPAVFLGIGIATLPVVWFDVSPTLAIAVGAAAGMAHRKRARRAPATRLSSFRRAAQRAVWDSPQSGDTLSRSGGTYRRHARTRSSTSSGDST